MSFTSTSVSVVAAILIAAYSIGQFTSKSIATEIEIAAPASAIWAELANTADYADWNPFLKYLSGDLRVGSTLAVTIQSIGNSTMDFTPTVLVSDEAQELRWIGHLGFKGIFDGEHSFVLEETPMGTTIFRQNETFSGMLAFILFALIGNDTESGFKAMNEALKARVEEKA
ncbi:SRPBCC domain-containing protein [Pararhizobium sp. IMCC21322]|uniref:SRPBCC domain-containing protein n=1 Tax=Pararhizobium sp. IMCC21322 TaxID=3067903 RepID=UPI0027408A8F|nr:SRPBCC domain-containing protein [Pararhizobium sp. IMCC21322]